MAFVHVIFDRIKEQLCQQDFFETQSLHIIGSPHKAPVDGFCKNSMFSGKMKCYRI